MIEPEVGHDLLELALGEDGADHLGLGELFADAVGGADVGLHGVEGFALARSEVVEEQVALVAGEVLVKAMRSSTGSLMRAAMRSFLARVKSSPAMRSGGGLAGFFGGLLFGVGGFGREIARGVGLAALGLAPELGDLHLVDGGEERVGGHGALAVGDLLDDAAVGDRVVSACSGDMVSVGKSFWRRAQAGSLMVSGLSC